MRTPDEVAAMLGLHGLGWRAKRIAAEIGCSRTTVKRYLGQGGRVACRRSERGKALNGLESCLAARFRQHRGNGDVVRQELLSEHGIAVSLRTVECAVAPLRRELAAESRATVRFETPPGRQLQVDFGERRVVIGGEPVRVSLFVPALSHSRASTCAPSGTSARHAGSRPWRVPSERSAACRRTSCSTTPGRWWRTTTA